MKRAIFLYHVLVISKENPPSTSLGQQENGVYWPIGMHLCRPQSDDAPFAGSFGTANAGSDSLTHQSLPTADV
jgi:hypothetical protein